MGSAVHARQPAAVAALESIGWHLRSVDIDLVNGRGIVVVERFDGLVVTLDGDSALRRGSITRERKVTRIVTVQCDASGPAFPTARASTEFIGRTRVSGFRSGLRELANYIGDNSTGDRALARRAVRMLASTGDRR